MTLFKIKKPGLGRGYVEVDTSGAATDHGLLTGLGDDDHMQYIKHALATAANDFLAASGAGAYVKKTLAETKTILGIGAGGFTFWNPDAPPASPTAQDDEFDNAALDVKWTEFDPGAKVTVTEGEVGLYLDEATQAADVHGGIYQAIPAGDFTIWAKLSLSSVIANSSRFGLCLWDDATDANGDLVTFVIQNLAAAETASVQLWASYTTYTSAYGGRVNTGQTHLYLRIRRVGTAYGFAMSSDGIGWEQVYGGNIAFVPDQFGIIISNANTGSPIRGFCQFFRYLASDSTNAGIMSGDRVNGWRA